MINSKIPAIILYLKVPKIGKVKTRLVSELINETQAYELQVEMIKDTLELLSSLKIEFQPIISYFPEKDLKILQEIILSFQSVIQKIFLDKILFIAQRGETNGIHFSSTFDQVLTLQNINSCIIIGGDTPHLESSIILDSLNWLNNKQPSAVVGPSQLGGFYIFGINDKLAGLENIFSKTNEFGYLLDICHTTNINMKILQFLFDIDTSEDVLTFYSIFNGIERNSKKITTKKREFFPHHTLNYLKRVIF